LLDIARRVEARLDHVLRDEETRWSDFDPDLASPVAEIRRLVGAGGKRLRPAFCHWGFVGVGGELHDPRVVDAGAALELLHAFALFHDDIMDGARTRRGEPVTHEVFAAEHRAHGSSGEARRYGEGMAILVGDLTFVMSDRLLDGVSAEARRIWHELRLELNIGQILDLMGSARHDRRRDKAERICRYKSGKYTIERPLHLGATIAAPDRAAEVLPKLSRYGLPLGDAFQMRDDVMGVFGDPSVTGKPVGDDLREGKPTPLLAIAVERATPVQRVVLDRVGRDELTDDDVAAVQQIIIDCGALDETERVIRDLSDRAVTSLDAIGLGVEARRELEALADFVTRRRT
jgi:geranylgeranyl diphosphate synthase type I